MKLNPFTFLAVLFLSGLNGVARGEALNLLEICENKSASAGPSLRLEQHEGEDLILVDRGFCETYRSSLLTPSEDPSGWKIRFYASHSFTRYFNSTMTFHSSRYNIEIKDYEWSERGSRDFFNPNQWFKDGHNPAQMIDEPTNTFTLSIEKNGNEFYLSAFHPKFLQSENEVKHITGTIDGVAVNGVLPINQPYENRQLRPGESKIIRNQFTYGQMIFEAGYAHRFVLIRSRLGNITYIPKVGVGVQIGKNVSTIAKPGQWWEYEDSRDQFRFQGVGASVSNRIELNSKNERVGIFYENRLGYYDTTAKFFDGTQHFGLGFVGNNFGVKFVLFHAKPKSTL
jgi:hypothetical protein